MTFIACKSEMLTFEQPTSLGMIKLVLRRLPLDKWEILAIVFGMTLRTILTCGAFGDYLRVKPAIFIDASGNFSMALEATENLVPARLMA
jgi:hypothetical protein